MTNQAWPPADSGDSETELLAKRAGAWIDQQTLCAFVFCYSRFEYALKSAGFANGNERRVEPDRHEFADWIACHAKQEDVALLLKSVKYLMESPPDTQILSVDSQSPTLDWRPTERGENVSDARWLLDLASTVRNNVFHGGKMSGLKDDAARTWRLIECAQRVICSLARLHPIVRDYFCDDEG